MINNQPIPDERDNVTHGNCLCRANGAPQKASIYPDLSRPIPAPAFTKTVSLERLEGITQDSAALIKPKLNTTV